MRNYYDFFQNNKNFCCLAHDTFEKFNKPLKEIYVETSDKYPVGLYFIKRKDLLSFPDNYSLKDIEIKDHYFLKMNKHRTIDINIGKK